MLVEQNNPHALTPPSTGIVVRPAVVDDLPRVLPMVRDTCTQHGAWDRERYATVDSPQELYQLWLTRQIDNSRGCFFVSTEVPTKGRREWSEDKEYLTGFVVGTIEPELPIYLLNEYGMVHDLWVEPPYRRTGIGQALINVVVERFATLGVRQVRLVTAVENAPARSLFSRSGFRPSTIEMLMATDETNGCHADLAGDQTDMHNTENAPTQLPTT